MFYDVVVLGAGPGGYVSAIRAAQLGAKTAIIEKNKVGGTCLNVGCIPTKALMKNVEILHYIDAGKKRGIKVKGELELDYAKAVKAKDKAVKQLVNGVTGLLGSNEITMYQGMGTVKAGNKIEVAAENGDVETIEYGKLILATGSSPKMPPIPGADLEGVMTSEGFLSITEVPEKLVVIGAGVIGCELATVFKAYGSQITMVEMMDKPVAILDSDVANYMEGILTQQGIDLKLGKQVKSIARNDAGSLDVTIADKDGNEEVVSGDKVLISIGRGPNVAGLDELGLETERGYVVVNDKLETSAKDVYAIGDVIGKKLLAHVASEMGVVAAENAMGASKAMDLSIVPSCLYTIPEVGCVGMSEKEAKDAGYDVICGKFPLVACGKAVATGDTEGMFKIVADKKTRKVLGAHLVGKSATELVAEMAAYMKMNATVDDVVDTIHAHPTISESIAEAARDIDNCTIHMPKK
ncbi:MAG: dihydrolipoyl dehydrogenase [Clostridia bacterium]